MKFKAVLFDLDGTLLDTIEDLADSMNSVLRRNAFPVHGLEAYKYFVGAGMENLVRRAIPRSLREDETIVTGCLQSMLEEYARGWKVKTRPYEAIPELLDALVDRGVKMAILSNKTNDLTQRMVEELLGSWRFEAVWGERSSVARKPDPTAAVQIAEQIGIPAHDFVYLGDTSIDMQTATSAGMYAVGALWGFRQADELLAAGAKALIGKPLDLLELI